MRTLVYLALPYRVLVLPIRTDNFSYMRFAVTLEDDVHEGIKEEMERSGESFKQAVNRLIRLAYDMPNPPTAREPEAKRAGR